MTSVQNEARWLWEAHLPPSEHSKTPPHSAGTKKMPSWTPDLHCSFRVLNQCLSFLSTQMKPTHRSREPPLGTERQPWTVSLESQGAFQSSWVWTDPAGGRLQRNPTLLGGTDCGEASTCLVIVFFTRKHT